MIDQSKFVYSSVKLCLVVLYRCRNIRENKLNLRIFSLLFLLSVGSCGTIRSNYGDPLPMHYIPKEHTQQSGNPYSGIAMTLSEFCNPNVFDTRGYYHAMLVADIPLSLLGDTLHLPVDLFSTPIHPPIDVIGYCSRSSRQTP